MTKKIMGLMVVLLTGFFLAGCAKSQEAIFKEMPISLIKGGVDQKVADSWADPKRLIDLSNLEENGADKETQEYIIERFKSYQDALKRNAIRYDDDKITIYNCYASQRFIYVVSEKYLDDSPERTEFMETALSEMIALKKKYEELTGTSTSSN